MKVRVPARLRRTAARRLALVMLLITTVALAAALASASGKPQAARRVYRIALSYPFPPWGVGPLEGVDFDLLTAICEANVPMDCVIEDRPSGDCVDTDENGQMIIGQALASGRVDGCMPWFGTDERKRLGAEFAEGYSRGPLPQLIAADGDGTYDGLVEGDSLGGADVGIIAGFFNDDDCLDRHFSNFFASFYDSDEEGRSEMVMDLLSANGGIDLAFWDSTETVPDGTHLVGRSDH